MGQVPSPSVYCPADASALTDEDNRLSRNASLRDHAEAPQQVAHHEQRQADGVERSMAIHVGPWLSHERFIALMSRSRYGLSQMGATAVLMRVSLAAGVGFVGNVGAPPDGPGKEPQEMTSFYDGLARAEEADAAGERARAAELYAGAYSALPDAERGGETGSDVVRAAVHASKDAYVENPHDATPLDTAISLLHLHLADLERLQPDRDASELRALLDSVRTLREASQDSHSEAAETSSDGLQPSNARPFPVADDATEPSDLRPSVGRKRLALGLLVGGGTTAAVGIGLQGFWAHVDCDEFRSPECLVSDTGLALGTTGAVLLAAGVAMLIAGSVLYVRGKRVAAANQHSPSLSFGALRVIARF